MAFTKAPVWNNQGSEPPENLKTSGFVAGYKPPAGYFNWFWNLTGVCLKELQEAVTGLPVATYHNSATGFDLNTTTEDLLIVTSALSKNCPVNGSEVLIQQFFYSEVSATAKRTQIAYPYGDSTSTGIAMRRYTGSSWTAWAYAGTESIQEEIDTLQTAVNGKQDEITGAASTVASSNLTANRALVANANGKIAVSAITATELGYLSGVTSNIQAQLRTLKTAIDSAVASVELKQDEITGAASSIATSNLTANRALISSINGKVAISAVTSTELGYLSGVKSKIQTQLDAKVGKTGGTLTGSLNFENYDDFGAVYKLRRFTAGGQVYSANFGCGGVGGEGVGCIELRSVGTDATTTLLGRLEVGVKGVSFQDKDGKRTYLHSTGLTAASVE